MTKISKELPKVKPNTNSLLLGFASLHPTYKIMRSHFLNLERSRKYGNV
ncbi:MAG: hypothetical protein F6K14_20880 [Symploca sp. SIO2C1]|nr:hypothetical protein [Symploca sp. SIO2C1]